MNNLENIIGYQFKDKGLLDLSLTHSSYANETGDQTKCNERLELTTDSRNRELEKRIEEEILFDIIWEKEVTYIQSEKVWNISYFFEI